MVWGTHIASMRASSQGWWISARVLAVNGSVGVVRILNVSALATWLAASTRVIVIIIHIVAVVAVISVFHAIHTLITHPAIVIPSKARAATCAASRALIVTCQSVSARKASTTLVANMWSLACVQFGMAFEVVQPSET